MRPDAVDWDDKQGVSLAFLPRQRMHRTLRRWIVAIALCQVVIAALALVVLQGPWRRAMRPDHAATVASLTAAQLSGRPLGEGDTVTQRLLRRVVADPAVSFAAVVDAEGRLLYSAAEADAKLDSSAAGAAVSDGSKPRVVAVDALASDVTVRTPLDKAGHALVLRVSDLATRRAVLDGAVALAAALLVVGLVVLPLACRRLRRWTDGLAGLHAAIRSLAHGAEPKPLPVGGEDEIAYLSIAFNDMASQLLVSRRDLLEANKRLEQRVNERTAELREAAVKLEQLATSDMLTGLPNRRALARELQSMFDAAVRTDHDLVCLAIDLDGFKTVNDKLGHASGDELLKVASEVFRGACRSGDLAARLGGDEFVLLVPAPNPEAVIPLAERLLSEFATRCGEQLAEAAIPALPSMSIGIASRKQTGVTSAERLLQAADAALYRAKGAGKNCFRLWQAEDGGASAAAAQASTAGADEG